MGKKTDLESVHLVNHSKCMLAAFQNFRQDETMLDVTLVCNGMSLKAHKLVLSACSPFFKEIFSENPCAHPIIILRAFEFSDLKAIIDFIYKGELSVPRERLMLALKVAEELQIRGLRRSEPNREKYEKLYNQVRGKLSGKKKRKRHHLNSSDSEEKECVSIPDSDQNVIESDGSSRNEETLFESQQFMEVDTSQENSEKDKNMRPVVLRVGDPNTNNDEKIKKNSNIKEENLVCMPEDSTSLIEEIEGLADESVSESVATTLQLNAYVSGSENFAESLEKIPTDEQNSSQEKQSTEPMSVAENSDSLLEEQNTEPMSATENSDSLLEEQYTDPAYVAENSEEQDGLTSSTCISPEFIEAEQTDEMGIKNEGKRFICSKCDSVFTSRINFMRHKSLSHKQKKNSYECKQCDFATEDLDCFKNHSQVHCDKVPYKCSSCPEEFTSEELYQEHLCVHKEKKTLHSLSSAQALLSMQNRNPEKNQEYRCSICFKKFSSKLNCQFHEKRCQGGE